MARGLAARSVSDKFIRNGIEWQFNGILYFSENESKTVAEQIHEHTAKNDIVVTHTNEHRSNMKAGILFSFSRGSKTRWFVRYFKQFSKSGLPFTWGGSAMSRATGFSLATKGAQSEHIQIKPSCIIPSENKLCSEEIIDLIRSNKNLPSDFSIGVSNMLWNLSNNKLVPERGMVKYQSTIEKYIGEYAAPIYMTNNKELMDFDQISFPLSANEVLVDSYVHSSSTGKSIGVSSKAKTGGGAAASISGISTLYDGMDASQLSTEEQQLVGVMKKLSDESMVDGPLLAAKDMYLIDDYDIDTIKQQIVQNDMSVKDLSPNLKAAIAMLAPKYDHPTYNIGYHLLSGVARLVCHDLNSKQSTTNVFKYAFKEKNFLQIYMSTVKENDGLRLGNFEVVDPVAVRAVKFSAAKPYMASTKPKGKITFVIEK